MKSKKFTGALVLSALGLLATCSPHRPLGAGTNGTPSSQNRIFSIDTPVYIIAADQSGRAVLERDIPDLMVSKSYPLVDDLSLSQIASLSGGQFTTAKLNQLEKDLVSISRK